MRAGISRLEVIPSIQAHWAGGAGDSNEDMEWLDKKLKEFLDEE